MCKKSLLFVLLMALFAPWAANAQNSIPFNEGFEGMTSVDDLTAAGWTLSTTESGTFLAIETTASNVYEGSKSLNLDAWSASSSSSVQYLGLPLMAGNLNTLQISFAYKVTSGTINVGYLTNATDFSTFVSMAQYSSSSSFAVKTVDLSEAPATAVRLAIKYTGWFRCYLDAFEVSLAPSCAAATSITASNITATSATITWEGEVGDYWNLDYNGTVVNNISALTYNLTGLTESTSYTVKVQNVCGDGTTTDWVSTSFTTPEICPENTVCVGEGTATHSYLPGAMYYYNSLTQQIYTAEELGEAGFIESIAFYSVQNQSKSHTFDIYMVATDKNAFESTTDWFAVTSADLVASATVIPTAGWNTFVLDNPFEYNGTSNVAVIVDVTASEYENGMSFYVYDAPTNNQAIYVYSDGTNYDPTAPSSYYGTRANKKNRLRLGMGEPPACGKPTGLTVNYEGGTTATVTWNAVEGATSYAIDINRDVTTGITTNSFTLTNLDLATTYEVKVNATCAAGTGDWTNPVTFNTELCMPEDKCAISFVVTDSYGDSWNGAAIQVYDYDTIAGELTLLAEVTNQNLDGTTGQETQTITLNVCDGRFLVFFWSSGNYDDECSYTVYDNLGDPIFSGSGAMDDYEIFFMNCNSTCRMPRNFAASEITGHEVMLSWTELGEATSWTLAYMAQDDEEVSYIEDITTNPYLLEGLTPNTKYYAMISPNCEDQYKWSDVITWTTDDACPKPVITVVPTPTSAEVSWTGYADNYEFEWAEMPETTSKDALWLQYDNGTMATGIGNGSTQYTWTWGVMYPATMLEGNGQLSKVSIYETAQYNTEDITINIYSGGDDAPGTLIYTETVTPAGVDGFHEITLAEVVTIDPTQNLWITLTEYGYYVIAACQGTESNNDWVEDDGWAHIGDLASSLAGYNWMIRGYVEPAYDPSTIVWTLVDPAVSPVTLDNLEPNTTYIVRIKALCGGEDGESAWTTVTFTTPDPCTTPFDLAANDVAAKSANLSWTGYQESYNLRYRQALPVDPSTPATIILEAHDVWSDGTGYQMLLDADATAYGDIIPETGNLSTKGSGEDAPAEVYAQFEYKIPVEADGALTTTNMVADGSVTIQIPAGTYDWCITNPTPGDCMYIAANGGNVPARNDDYVFEPGKTYHFTMQLIGTGDGAVLEITQPMSDWTTVENIPNPYAFTGLTPETAYEWQVQGVNCSEGNNTEWSEISEFTTTEQTTLTQTLALTAGTNWISTYVDITLDNLKDALVAALPGTTMTIKSQNAYTLYNGTRWRGSLNEFDAAQMYMVIITADCEITLEGEPVNPADISINIGPGSNWIGFPFSESMSVANAFANYTATANDMLKSQGAYTLYNGTRWRGQLNTLVPGQGYIYISVSSETNPFTYPTNTSKAAQMETSGLLTNTVLCKTKVKYIDLEKAISTTNLDKSAKTELNPSDKIKKMLKKSIIIKK